MTGELVLLGTGTSHGVPVIGCNCNVCRSTDPHNNRTRTGVAVQVAGGTFLIDSSPELRIQLLREKIELAKAVIYTHAHADHLFGLDDLRVFGYRLNSAIPLYCEPIVEQTIRRAFDYVFNVPENPLHPGALPKLEFHTIGLEPFTVLGQPIVPIRLLHGTLPVLGYRLGDVAFCTDVNQIPEESWPRLEGLDVLIIDAIREKAHATHFGIEEALQVVERVRPRQTYLTHISHHLDHELTNRRLPPHVRMAYDGLRIAF